MAKTDFESSLVAIRAIENQREIVLSDLQRLQSAAVVLPLDPTDTFVNLQKQIAEYQEAVSRFDDAILWLKKIAPSKI